MCSLRLSTFCITAKQPDDNLRLMNTLWRSIAELDVEHQALLRQMLHEQGSTDITPYEQPAWIEDLVAVGILTRETPEAEANAACEQLRLWKANPQTLLVTFAITFACNFRCVYCIQEGNYQARPSMTGETLEQALAWCRNHVATYNLKRISVNLFGGEPTLAYNSMIRTMIGIRDICNQLALEPPEFQLVSNGFLLNRERLTQLRSYGLVDLQVTVDGTRETHNARRKHAGGRNTYDQIWENALLAIEIGINTRILSVVDSHNSHEMFSLVDYAGELAESAGLMMKMRENLEFQFCTVVPTNETCARNVEVLFDKEVELESQIAKARAYARSLGFRAQDPFTVEVCFREYVHSVLIDPEGYLHKCYGSLGDSRYRLGHVSDPVPMMHDKMVEWAHFDPWDTECLSCAVFPLCRASCQFTASEANEGRYGQRFCQRDLLLHLYQTNLREGIF